MKPDKNHISQRLQVHGADPTPLKSPAANDRLSMFNARRLAYFGCLAAECAGHAHMYPGNKEEQSLHCFHEIRAVCGSGIGYA